MNRKRMAAVIALATVAVAAVSGSLALASGQSGGNDPSGVRAPETIRVLDITNSVQPNNGGVQIQTTLKTPDGGSVVGHAYIQCFAPITTTGDSECIGTYRLTGRGDIQFSGFLGHPLTFSVSISGGTGEFDDVGAGQIRIHNLNAQATRSIDTIDLD